MKLLKFLFFFVDKMKLLKLVVRPAILIYKLI